LKGIITNSDSSFKVKCLYTDPKTGIIIPTIGPTLPTTISIQKFQPFSVEDQVSIQAEGLLSTIRKKQGNLPEVWVSYFLTFNHALPIIDQEAFYQQLNHNITAPRSHFPTVLLSVYLVTRLLPKHSDGNSSELYATLKSIHSLLQSTGNVSIELIRAGLLIGIYEHAQALHRDAWLTVGSCVRIGHVLGLHTLVGYVEPSSSSEAQRVDIESRRRLWWGAVVLERWVVTRIPIRTPTILFRVVLTNNKQDSQILLI
jgi:hypothetical protein